MRSGGLPGSSVSCRFAFSKSRYLLGGTSGRGHTSTSGTEARRKPGDKTRLGQLGGSRTCDDRAFCRIPGMRIGEGSELNGKSSIRQTRQMDADGA